MLNVTFTIHLFRGYRGGEELGFGFSGIPGNN
jgi:hypothetical protein